MKFKRLGYIDIIKAVAIILVIVGHINYQFFCPEIKRYIYSFHMPIFFFVIGLLAANRSVNNINFKDYFIKKLKSIYVPYILWALIYAQLTPKNIIFILYGSHQALKVSNNSSLWFLPCYFIVVLVFEMILLLQQKIEFRQKIKYILVIITFLCGVGLSLFASSFTNLGYLLSLPISLVGLFFAIFGLLIGYLLKSFKNISSIKLVLLSILFFCGTLLYQFNDGIEYVLMAENIYGNVFLFVIVACCGCIFVTCLSLWLERILNKGSVLLQYIGQNTLIIFAIQQPILSLLTKVFDKVPVILPDVLIILITVPFVIGLCYIFIKIFDVFVPQLSGKTIKSR